MLFGVGIARLCQQCPTPLVWFLVSTVKSIPSCAIANNIFKWTIPSQYTAFIYSKGVNACQDVELVAETAKAILGLVSHFTNAVPLKSDHC